MLFSKIVIAYDGSKASNKAFDKAIELVKAEPGAQLYVVHVHDYQRGYIGEILAPIPASVIKELNDAAVQIVEEVKQRVKDAGVNGVVDMIQGSPAEAILNYAKEKDADVIVMGSRGLGTIREFVLGSVSHNVVQHSKIPVLIMK
ncbi:universal stress protein [Paenibacillus sediminis]|uniref:Nucleotide-binding universal stress UspA family protein n=1 Tax=Paenibacillus sediminis TaxID=664909 RepID=A0ABS4H5G1_9BACL|nr:universal stress protein [Paenibacillus sediminis]MBP1937701.1 nucleotide-binding universal stress UspA family protein [Paenibacillus sediminis]